MDVREFDFDLPADLIAQEPAAERSAARLLYLNRDDGSVTHTAVRALPDLLRAGDLVVVNNTKVFPARLLGRRVPSGGAVECLLVSCLKSGSSAAEVRLKSGSSPAEARHETNSAEWEALMHPGQKLKPGARVVFEGLHTLHGEVLERHFFGRRLIRLWTEDGTAVSTAIDAIGHVPLPPYIKRGDRAGDRDRYQTVFARARGSVAAPTAGLHFTPALLAALKARGVEIAEITLHVGYGTFQPVRVDRVEDHRLESEQYDISEQTAATINQAHDQGRRVIAVGTTTTRTLEAVAGANAGRIAAGGGTTDLFIYPGYDFHTVTGLLTNFHLPRSSLLMLVAAFAGAGRVLAAYHAAIAERYRFYSYGDAMLIL
jgi:S-adenosylmethionine:tRNA ribosyltransferase-isomerase